jgi:gas vesicle protein
MSVSSTSSIQSVSYQGSEIPLEEALDSCFLDLQGFMNGLHCHVRELAGMSEQDDDFMVSLAKGLVINDTIDNMQDLFKELKSVVKQIIGNPPKELKQEAKKLADDAKEARKRAKELEKEEQKMQQSMSSASLN